MFDKPGWRLTSQCIDLKKLLAPEEGFLKDNTLFVGAHISMLVVNLIAALYIQ